MALSTNMTTTFLTQASNHRMQQLLQQREEVARAAVAAQPRVRARRVPAGL
jgi:hypothetical protein